MALLLILLKVIEYHFLARHLRLEIYLSAVAVLFTGLGIWVGLKLTWKSRSSKMPSSANPEEKLNATGISPREFAVLKLMAKGQSNQEIADTLFISVNTVKTHSSNLFTKLDVNRRTQAVRRARELELI